MDQKLLDFYSNALKIVVGAPSSDHISALDRVFSQSQAQIAQDRLLSVIERLVAPAAVQETTEANALKNILSQVLLEKEESQMEEPIKHPSPFSEDIDLGSDEPALTLQEQEADQQLKDRIREDIGQTWEGILKPGGHE